MVDSIDLDGRDRRPFERGEQNPSEGIPDGGSKSSLEGFSSKAPISVRASGTLDFNALRHLKLE
jgi:hypothetical protein